MKQRLMNIAIILVVSVSLVGTLSVVGVLQSTDRVSSSGIIVQSLPAPPLPPPPEPTIDIGVYSNYQCTQSLSNIEWGDLQVGGSVNRMIWIKNVGDSDVYLGLTTENWTPSGVAQFIDLSWDYDGSILNSGATEQIILTLSVDPTISGINEFYFDIVFVASVQ
jgi:hypothetical protein